MRKTRLLGPCLLMRDTDLHREFRFTEREFCNREACFLHRSQHTAEDEFASEVLGFAHQQFLGHPSLPKRIKVNKSLCNLLLGILIRRFGRGLPCLLEKRLT